VPLFVLFSSSLYAGLGLLGEAYGGTEAKAVICEDDGPCILQFSNSSGTFTLEGPANITASMTPLESSLFDYEMELFDREMD
jgi:hypothetical protein